MSLSTEGDPNDYFAALHRVSRTLNSSLDPDEVLNRAMDTVVELLGAERGYILLADDNTGELHYAVARNMDRQTVDDPNEISQTVIARVVAEQRSFVTLNAGDDPRLKGAQSVVRFGLRSVACAPLLVEGRLLGVVYVDNRLREGVFQEPDADALMAFANIAAIAIRNARLHAALARGVEERLRLQQELHEEELRRATADEASRVKSEMVAWVSHELATPISSITMSARALQRDTQGTLTPEIRAELHEVREIEKLIASLAKRGVDVGEYFLRREETVTGELPPAKYVLISDGQEFPAANVAQIAPGVHEIGRQGMDIKRFKGLGEMNADQLWETTMDPERRVLLQVRIDEAEETERIFSLLMGEDVTLRRNFIETHALEVKNLDV